MQPFQRFKRVVLIGLGLVGIIICGYSIVDRVCLQYYLHQLTSSEPRVRDRAFKYIDEGHDARAADTVFSLLERQTDRDLLEKTAYTAMRLRDARAVPLLRKRAEVGPDDATRAKLFIYAARLSNRDARLIDWLRAGTTSTESWHRAGSALGLLELGQTEGGESLIKMAHQLDPGVRDWAFEQFRDFADRMAQVVGHRMDGWDSENAPAATDLQLAQYAAFWGQYASATLLSDVLIRRARTDDQWLQMNRLLHAQDRMAHWLASPEKKPKAES